MKKLFAPCLLLATLGVTLSGCGCGGGNSGPQDGLKPEVNKQMSDMNDIAVRVKGDWKLMTPEEKAKFIATFGDQKQAKNMVKLMANPPNAKYQKKN